MTFELNECFYPLHILSWNTNKMQKIPKKYVVLLWKSERKLKLVKYSEEWQFNMSQRKDYEWDKTSKGSQTNVVDDGRLE